MTAADRIAELDKLPAAQMCARAEKTLTALLTVMNEETTLLRAGHYKQAATVTAEKARISQEYVVIARAVQRASPRLKIEQPAMLNKLRDMHESFATQMAENLRVLATARAVTQNLLSDVAQHVGTSKKTQTYGANGSMPSAAIAPSPGLSINKAL
jgi:flagellar biosynthesis/type III secretory pathway chaperone